MDPVVARLIYRAKFVYPEGAIREMVIWELPASSGERPHGLKYSLHCCLSDGSSVARYDNEQGKGDHRHLGHEEEPYRFVAIETLVTDFLAHIRRARSKGDG